MKLPGFQANTPTSMPTMRPAIQGAPPQVRAKQVNYIPATTPSQVLQAGLREADMWRDVIGFGGQMAKLGTRITTDYETEKGNQAWRRYENVVQTSLNDRVFSPEYNAPQEVQDHHGNTRTVRAYESMDQEMEEISKESVSALENDGLLDSKLARRIFEDKRANFDKAVNQKVTEHVWGVKMKQTEAGILEELDAARTEDDVDEITDRAVAMGIDQVKMTKANLRIKQKVRYNDVSRRLNILDMRSRAPSGGVDPATGNSVLDDIYGEIENLQLMQESGKNVSFEQSRALRGKLQTMLNREHGELDMVRTNASFYDWYTRARSPDPTVSGPALEEPNQPGFWSIIGLQNTGRAQQYLAEEAAGLVATRYKVDEMEQKIINIGSGVDNDVEGGWDMLSNVDATVHKAQELRIRWQEALIKRENIQSEIRRGLFITGLTGYSKYGEGRTLDVNKLTDMNKSFENWSNARPDLPYHEQLDGFMGHYIRHVGGMNVENEFWLGSNKAQVDDWKQIDTSRAFEQLDTYTAKIETDFNWSLDKPGPVRTKDMVLPPHLDQEDVNVAKKLKDWDAEKRAALWFIKAAQDKWIKDMPDYISAVEIREQATQMMQQGNP